MDKKNIESLVAWLILALALSTVVGTVLGEYSKSIVDSGSASIPFGMSIGSFVSTMLYASFVVNSLVNIVIALWVFQSADSKKLLWILFSLLAGWWALPVFIYYQYYAKETHNQSFQQKAAE